MHAPKAGYRTRRATRLAVVTAAMSCAAAGVGIGVVLCEGDLFPPPEVPPFVVPVEEIVTCLPAQANVTRSPQARIVAFSQSEAPSSRVASNQQKQSEVRNTSKPVGKPALAVAGLTEAEAADITAAITAALTSYSTESSPRVDVVVGTMVDIMREILPMLPHYLEAGIVTYSRHENRIGRSVEWKCDRSHLVGDVEGDSTTPQFRVTIGRNQADAITFKIPDNIASPASWVRLRKGLAGIEGIHASWN